MGFGVYWVFELYWVFWIFYLNEQLEACWLFSSSAKLLLPARRYASAGLCDSDVSVRPSVCLSVTRRYCA